MKTNRIVTASIAMLFCVTGCKLWRDYQDEQLRLKSERLYESYNYLSLTDRNLTWQDFKGPPVYSSSKSAEVIWHFFYYKDASTDSANVFNPNLKIWCAFDERSWVDPAFKSDYLLNHEQGHFNLVKIYADSMKNEIRFITFSRDNWKKKIDSLKNNIVLRCKLMQDYYDADTDYARKTKKQVIWDSIIAYKLASVPR